MRNIVRNLALVAASTVSAFILVACCCGSPIASTLPSMNELNGDVPMQARAEIPLAAR